MENRPSWVIDVESDLALGQQSYRRAAQRIVNEMEAARKRGERLTQFAVAEHLGRSPTWVSRLIGWYNDGCEEATVFGGEIAARRKLRRRNLEPWLQDPDTGKVIVDVSEQPEAAAVLKARHFCEQNVDALNGVTQDVLAADAWSPSRHLEALEDLRQRLRQVTDVSERALKDVEAVLSNLRPPPEDTRSPGDTSENTPF